MVGSTTDAGYFGAGIYFSEMTAYSAAYDRTGGTYVWREPLAWPDVT